MKEQGFTQGMATPCAFYHAGRDIRCVVHGDDFTLLGTDAELNWFRNKISIRYDVKFRGRLGIGEGDDKSIRILNRIVEWGEEGIKYEADQRHAEIITRDLGLIGGKYVVSLGVKDWGQEAGGDESPGGNGDEAEALHWRLPGGDGGQAAARHWRSLGGDDGQAAARRWMSPGGDSGQTMGLCWKSLGGDSGQA